MKAMKIMRKLLIAAAVLGAASCDVDDSAKIPFVELGTPQNEYILEADGWDIQIDIFSNGKYRVEYASDAPWLTLSRMEGNGDGQISASVSMNEEFKRMASLVLCSEVDERKDTILIKQKGMLEAKLQMLNTSIILDGKGGKISADVTTNIPFEYMRVQTAYSGDDADWIESMGITAANETTLNRSLDVTVKPNADQSKVRTASVLLSYIDGWGDLTELLVNLVQKNAREELGTVTPFYNIRYDYATGDKVEDYIILEGVVVSNTPGGNAGENEQSTTSSIDYDGSKKTVYVQSPDGKYGFALITETLSDNVFNQFDRVQILLHGTRIVAYENPERFEIKGVTKTMIVSQTAGDRVTPKVKAYNELTDDDIYTYVAVKDVEFPVRKGSITPINEGYSIGGKANRISKYPLLVRDRNGDSFYMYTNTVCVYRNDGTRLPYGSGNLSGVLVHERFSRFNWKNGADLLDIDSDEELGNIGRYQIRHQSKEDIWGDMNSDFKDSFSELLTEYRFWNPDTENGVLRPTYGQNGWFTHTYQTRYTGSETKNFTNDAYGQHMYPEVCYSYLGPMGVDGNSMFGVNYGNINGLGIIIDPEKEYYNEEMGDWVATNRAGELEWLAPSTTDEESGIRLANAGNMKGKTWCATDCYCSMSHRNWWDYDLNQGYAWMLNFSTKDISTDCLSLQISVMNTSQKWYAPRFWKVEWSETDSMSPSDASSWKLVGEYTVPDISVWANTLYSSIVGYKSIDFKLPLEMLGKENVYVRLIPVSDLCSSGAEYADAVVGTDVNGDMHASAIEYIAVRYNK